MRIIVTGGAGFIGSTLVDRLLGDGAEVTVVDNFDDFYPRAVKESNLSLASANPRFRLVELDIRDAEGVRRLVGQVRPEAIVHLAARAGVRPSIEAPSLYADVNVVGTVHWLEAASRLEPRPRFVYASSSSVYGDRPDAPFRETTRSTSRQPLCGDQEGLRAACLHVPPSPRPAGHRPEVLHRVRAEESPGPGDRQVHRG